MSVTTVPKDMISVMQSLEAHWSVLEAEIEVINKDIDHIDGCIRKYGDYFVEPLRRLKELKNAKSEQMREIIKSLEALRKNIDGGRRLLRVLDRGKL
ncbi:hypothetical protein ADUPG1_009912 [Aduncisulcus paluster]|uniref:Uncharacterized protein n=1 Tax=Aduncisulcus paluster TaxID=2918883 RepID=A0ABQ5KX73_9EUKA|nr:hypothetical protein ADUPG1_009912 [Aduncisulcus paluster]